MEKPKGVFLLKNELGKVGVQVGQWINDKDAKLYDPQFMQALKDMRRHVADAIMAAEKAERVMFGKLGM